MAERGGRIFDQLDRMGPQPTGGGTAGKTTFLDPGSYL